MTANRQLSWTRTLSPSPVATPSPVPSTNTGSGTTGLPLLTGRSQLLADASPRTWLSYRVWTAASAGDPQASGLFAA